MKLSFCLVLSFSLVLASALPADWSTWNTHLDDYDNGQVYNKLGEIFKDNSNFVDLKLARVNGLAVPYPDKVVQFFNDDSFPSMNWNTFPDFETPNLNSWVRDDSHDTVDEEQEEVFLPKWTTQWGKFEEKSSELPAPLETGSESETVSVSESTSQSESEETSQTEAQDTDETQSMDVVVEDNYVVEEDDSIIWFMDTTLKDIYSSNQQVATDAATNYTMPLEFNLEGAIVRPRLLTCLDKKQNRIEDECLAVALSWMNLQFGKNYMECRTTSETLKNKIYELTGQNPDIDESCRAIQIKEMRVLYSDCIISSSAVKKDENGDIDKELWKKKAIASSTLSEMMKRKAGASFDTCMASKVVLPYTAFRWNVWNEHNLTVSMKAFVSMTDNLLRIGHLKPSKSMIAVDCMRSAMFENGCANVKSEDYLSKLMSGWSAINLRARKQQLKDE